MQSVKNMMNILDGMIKFKALKAKSQKCTRIGFFYTHTQHAQKVRPTFSIRTFLKEYSRKNLKRKQISFSLTRQ